MAHHISDTEGPLHYLSLTEVARLVRERAISPTELTAYMLERIASLDAGLHSYALVMTDSAMKDAERAEKALAGGKTIGPLHGVPVAVKDLFWTKGAPTAAGMPLHANFVAQEDATVVRLLREAGAVILGKHQMTEGAFIDHHPSIVPPLSPWDAELWPGASSSGSGVATAAGLCFGAVGSDTGGSIRLPCAANGLTGIKPSWGRVSRHGTFELAATLDHFGPIARSAADAALLLSVIAGHDPSDPTSTAEPSLKLEGEQTHLSKMRIGFDPRWNENGSDTDTQRAMEGALATFGALGADVCEIRLPEMRPLFLDWVAAAGMECAVAHAATYWSRSADYGPALSHLIETGRNVTPAQIQHFQLLRMALRNAFKAVFATVDLILLPVQPYAAPSLDQMSALGANPAAGDRLSQYTVPFNMTGHPAMTFPGGATDDGFPIGLQLVADQWREELLCSAVAAFQENSEWHKMRPMIGS